MMNVFLPMEHKDTSMRQLAQKPKTGNAKAANNVGELYFDNVDPPQFEFGQEPSATDFELICNKGNPAKNIYGSLGLPVEPECWCDASFPSVNCVFGTECNDDFCSRTEHYWVFDTNSQVFYISNYCSICESGNCPTAGFCIDTYYDTVGEAPHACLLRTKSFEGGDWQATCQPYTGCFICTQTDDGDYGVHAPSCGFLTWNQCYGGPTFRNPFPVLRAQAAARAETNSQVGAIVGGLLGFLVFVAVGVAIYYFVYTRVPADEDSEGEEEHKKRTPVEDDTEQNSVDNRK